MAQFAPGDLAQLKSGGPVMTVNRMADGAVHTIWFAGYERMNGVFPEETVHLIDPEYFYNQNKSTEAMSSALTAKK